MWLNEWRAISARIQALLDAGAFFLRTPDSEMHNASHQVILNADATAEKIREFNDAYHQELQADQQECISLFLKRYSDDLRSMGAMVVGFSGVTSVVTYLASFRAEFEYLSKDATQVARSLVARAFTHLQRLLVADEQTRKIWQDKFAQGEIACEALGACHLLLHGIWAFKTSAAGERTDLVMNEPLDISSGEIQRTSMGLVLTEWKIVRDLSQLAAKLDGAYQQAKRYRQGILAGFEVASPRYLVIVSQDYIQLPEPTIEQGVVYEYRNVAVSPTAPSKVHSGRRPESPRTNLEDTSLE
jgi:hypothetical protein